MDTLRLDLESATELTTPRSRGDVARLRVVSEAAAPTLAALYAERVRLSPDAAAFTVYEEGEGWQTYRWRDLEERAQRYAAALHRSGLSPGDRVGVHIANHLDWFAIDWAVHQLGLVMVALYADDTGASMAHMLADSGARLAILKHADDWRAVRQCHSLSELHTVVLHRGPMHDSGLKLTTLEAWLPAPEPLPPSRAEASAMATIVYTSGATGSPKGVMLSHANVIANVFACLRAIPPQIDDLRLSVLPLAHMFERTAGGYVSVAGGACTAFARGPATLGEDLQRHRPTILVAVPRIFEKLHAVLTLDLSHHTSARRAMFRLAVETGWRAQRSDLSPRQRRWLPLGLTRRVGQAVLARLGGRLRVAIAGGAALAPEVARTFVALGIPLVQGYGLTEASPVVATNRLDDNEPGSAGLPLDNVQTRVGPGGELMVRGPSVMMGYWRDREATERAIDAAGWLHTGDKVSRLDTSRIYMVGRIKELIVTATGEKASPSDIETRLRQLAVVDQVMVVGEARPYLGALIVAEREAYRQLCATLHVDPDDVSDGARTKVECALQQQCSEILRTASKNHQVRRVALVSEPWTIASGMLTPSMKLRRAVIERRFPCEIERIYRGHVLAERTDCSSNAGVG